MTTFTPRHLTRWIPAALALAATMAIAQGETPPVPPVTGLAASDSVVIAAPVRDTLAPVPAAAPVRDTLAPVPPAPPAADTLATAPVRDTLVAAPARDTLATVRDTLATAPAVPLAPPARDTLALAAPATAPPPSTVAGIRNKISAGDLLSAESVLEAHRAKYGEDGAYLTGLSWLARGALLLGDRDKAARYVAGVRDRCARRIAGDTTIVKDHDTEIALGAAIEVEAQLIERSKGKADAVRFLRMELERHPGPVAFRARLNKRINLLSLTGTPAPELAVEDYVGDPPPSLASLRGRPVLLFVWAEYCSDCKAQAAALAHVRSLWAPQGLQIVALTRYYETDPADRAREKARVDSVWSAVYSEVGPIPRVISSASMERYGGSSTPTYVFVDKEGIVQRYTPTRLTEAEFDRTLAALVK
jgi:cytochrome c biogenesis protein CcmG/thiol:disulfide interchange protein DsbE